MKCECGGDMKHHDKAVRIVRENSYCTVCYDDNCCLCNGKR